MFKILPNINKTNNSIQNFQTRNMHFQLECKFSSISTLEMSPQAYTEKLKGPTNWWKWELKIISSLNLKTLLNKQNWNLHRIILLKCKHSLSYRDSFHQHLTVRYYIIGIHHPTAQGEEGFCTWILDNYR